MKKLSFLLLLFLSVSLYSQNHLSYFPHRSGDIWLYDYADFIGYQLIQSGIFRDSTDSDGNIYLSKRNLCLTNGTAPPASSGLYDTTHYIISDSNLVYSDYGGSITSGDSNGYFLKYKLDADNGESWVVGREIGNNVYNMAKIKKVFSDTVLQTPVTCKEILYYLTQDTTDTSTNFRQFSEVIATDFGVIECQNRLLAMTGYGIRGAIIGETVYGDTSGIHFSRIAEKNSLRKYYLLQNYPNPFNSVTNIVFVTEAKINSQITVYDITGRRVKNLGAKTFYPGTHKITWDATDDSGNDVSSGIYFYVINTGNQTYSHRIVFIR